MTINERRDLMRYELAAPATIEYDVSSAGSGFFYLLTRDISGGGAYFQTQEPLQPELPVKVKICLEVGKLGELPLGGHVLLLAEGTVLRSDAFGMAVKFKERCQVVPVS